MRIDDKPKEECAVFGISLTTQEAAGITYNALLSMQHRGQEGSGIAVISDNTILYHKNTGLVSEVFNHKVLEKLPKSNVAVGHNRYSTTGMNVVNNVQPFITEYLTGRIATVHNGNITNAKVLRERLKSLGVHFDATSDSEVISSLIGFYIVKLGDSLQGVIKAASLLEGAFTLIVMCGDGKLIAVRDGTGYRPLCIGRNESGFCVASESCALESCGFHFERDIEPGEIVLFENGELLHTQRALKRLTDSGICIFEYVYFARPDSIIDHLPVYEARYNMGVTLAEEYPVAADVVCGVPDSGLEAAAGYSAKSKIPLVSGFVKNRYIGRSFIYPTQSQREGAVRLKLNPLRTNVEGKHVVLVDDSIVRGTTSRKIVAALKSAGALSVHMRISSPPFQFTCHYGTDIDDEKNLIANKMSLEAIRRQIGADSLGYISIDGLKKACEKCSLSFCTKCFTGHTTTQNKHDLEG